MVWALIGDKQRNALQEIISSRSERIIAVVGGTILDESLQRTLEERLRNNEKGESDISEKLFKIGGPLGNLGPKIDLAYQLYAIDKPTRNASYGISEIRNFFAHNLDASFDSMHTKMVEARGKLTLHKGRSHYPFHLEEKDSEYEIDPMSNNIDTFLVNLKLVLVFLMRDRSRHVTWSNYMLPGWTPTAPQEMPKS